MNAALTMEQLQLGKLLFRAYAQEIQRLIGVQAPEWAELPEFDARSWQQCAIDALALGPDGTEKEFLEHLGLHPVGGMLTDAEKEELALKMARVVLDSQGGSA